MANTRVSDLLQILVYLKVHQGEEVSSQLLASSLKTNPSQVRKMIAQLRDADILAARQNNRYDNFARDLDQITVLDVYRATAPKNPFLVPDQETSGQCSVGVAFPEVITKHFAEVQVGIEQRLDQITVQQLVDETLANIAEHENRKEA
ncbi:Rrf2 family transcriptional regulator [Limosilactobacillus fermentum]|uniref:Rrf2 family transcriptional regulator n=1 Tax=Limosilactobacillus fermentum TaxID=1613 RepID=UPI0009BF9EBF|nr:Rrf2 family transcriptional regulator [Limosilactobacillus fermentum]